MIRCPRIQIAGVLDTEEALMLAREGVDSIGFPLRLAVHAQDTTEQEAARIIRALPGPIVPVNITYETDPAALDAMCRALGVQAVQIHSDISVRSLAELKTLRPDLFVIKSLIVPPDALSAMDELEARAQAFAPHCDAFLTDSFDPASGATGATGKTHDWEASRCLALASPRPLILAGGLNATNVREAIRTVRPAGVDAHTGVETPDGRKSPELIRAFVREARAGFSDITP